MKIKKIDFMRLDMPLAVPYTIAYETVSETSNIILKLTAENGLSGWGCAAPDLQITGETAEDVVHNIKTVITEVLDQKPAWQIARVNQVLKERLPQASSSSAMVDIALHDLMARQAALPLYQLLGGFRDSIPTSITIGIMPLSDTLQQAGAFLQKGFSILKLKGGHNLEEDIEKVMLLREKYGKKFVIRFDANQGYSAEQSIAFIKHTRSANIEIFEQPIPLKTDENLGQVTREVEVPVMADESIKTLKDAFRLAKNDLIDMVNIKIMKVGGILEAQHINSVAKAAGMEVMVGCLDECALGISAGLHFALSRPNIEFADLDGHLDLLDDPFNDLFTIKNGVLFPSSAHGLGNIENIL